MRQALGELTVGTSGQGFTDVTAALSGWLSEKESGDGLLTVLIRHISASLTIQENADPDVLADLLTALDGFAPRGAPYRHDAEGPDDMPAPVRSMLTGANLAIPVREGRMQLGTWQGVYLIEHRDRPHRRQVALHYIGS